MLRIREWFVILKEDKISRLMISTEKFYSIPSKFDISSNLTLQFSIIKTFIDSLHLKNTKNSNLRHFCRIDGSRKRSEVAVIAIFCYFKPKYPMDLTFNPKNDDSVEWWVLQTLMNKNLECPIFTQWGCRWIWKIRMTGKFSIRPV